MKNLKIILAWLDWSSYCGDNYSRPNNLCSLFWRTFFTIITLPLTYIPHIYNLIFPKDHFRYGYGKDHKLYMGTGIVIHILLMILGFLFSKGVIEQKWQWNWFYMSDPFWLNYLKCIGVGIAVLIVILIMVSIILLTLFGLHLIYEYINKKFGKSQYEKIAERKPNMFITIYKAIKDKYCPLIDWSDIETK